MYNYLTGPNEEEIAIELRKVYDHPPSFQKLEETFINLYRSEESLSQFLINAIPEYRQLWLSYLPKVSEEELDLPYNEIAEKVLQYCLELKALQKATFKRMSTANELQTLSTYNQYKSDKEHYKGLIQTELERLGLNSFSVEKIMQTESFHTHNIYELLKDIALLEDLVYLLPSQNQISWVDSKYVEDLLFSKTQILERETVFEDKYATTPYAKGELIRFSNNGEYAYIVRDGDNFSGIEDRFNIKREDLLEVNWWDEIDKEGMYSTQGESLWLHEGDIITLPHYYQPLNGETFYKYDRLAEKGIKSIKEQGAFVNQPMKADNYQKLRKYLREKINKLDDNTRTYSFSFNVSLQMTTKVTAFFYIGVTIGGGVEMGSGDSRSFDVTSQCYLNVDAGFGYQGVANVGGSAGAQGNLNPEHFNSLNGSYSSFNHFEAYLSKSIYSFMVANKMEDAIKKHGLGLGFWEREQEKEDGVWFELGKGYVQKIRRAYYGQAGAGVKGVGSLVGGRKYQEAETLKIKGITELDQLLQSETVDMKKAKENDETVTDYLNVSVGDGYKLEIAIKDVASSTNQKNLGEYLTISLTLPGQETLGDVAKAGLEMGNFIASPSNYIKEAGANVSESEAVKVYKEDKKLKSDLNRVEGRITDREVQIEALDQSKEGKNRKGKRATDKKIKVINKEKSSYVKTQNKIINKKLANRKNFKKKIIDKFKNEASKKFAVKIKPGGNLYLKLQWNLQKLNGNYRLLNFKTIGGEVTKADLSAEFGVVSAGMGVSTVSEIETLEILGTNTINSIALTYDGIFKEGLSRLSKKEQDKFNDYIKEATAEAKEQGPLELFRYVSASNLADVLYYVEKVVKSYESNQRVLNLAEIEQYYKGVLKKEKTHFQALTSNIKTDFQDRLLPKTNVDFDSLNPSERIILECLGKHILGELKVLKYKTPIVSTSNLFKNHGVENPKYDALQDSVLKEKTASGQWTKYKNTRDYIKGIKYGKGDHSFHTIAYNFANDIRMRVWKYAEILPAEKVDFAKWEDCPLDELSPEQARLYLGDLSHIVKYVQGRQESKNVEGLFDNDSANKDSKISIDKVRASRFMKLILQPQEEEVDYLESLEKDILYPLILENKVYGNQKY